MRNPSYDAYFLFFIFWATFGRNVGVATTRTLMVCSLQTQPVTWPTGCTFWANSYLEIMFSKFSGVPSDTPLTNNYAMDYCASGHVGLHCSAADAEYSNTPLTLQ